MTTSGEVVYSITDGPHRLDARVLRGDGPNADGPEVVFDVTDDGRRAAYLGLPIFTDGDARGLAHAILAALDETPAGPFSDAARQEIAAAESRGYRRGLADRAVRAYGYTADDVRAAEALGYTKGVEAGQHSERGAISAGLPQRVSAVEVEVFREAWQGAEPGNRIRSGLEAVEQYRAWKASA